MQGTGAVAPPLSHVFVSFALPLISKVTLATGALQLENELLIRQNLII